MTSEQRKTNPKERLRRIQVLNLQRRFSFHRAAVVSFCDDVLHLLLRRGSLALSVVFVSSRKMRAMNQQYLGRDYATDVLSFSYDEEAVEGCRFLGEIIIAPQVAVLQAARCKTRAEDEMRRLLVHGILHLLGYNHETDRGEMNRLQANLLRRKSLAASPAMLKKKETR